MTYEEIIPYLNSLVRLNLINKKRKLGWLVVDHYHEISKEPLKEIYCINMRFGKKHFQSNRNMNMDILRHEAEVFQIQDILTIRSCL